MKARFCPKCGSNNLDVEDCGYSSFNVSWVRCKVCKLTAKVTGDSAVKEWNKWAQNPIEMLIKQIRQNAQDRSRRAYRHDVKEIDVSEYAADLISDLIADKEKA